MNTVNGRRLGNLMFNYASLLGIAQRNNLVPTIDSNSSLLDIFQLKTKIEIEPTWFNSRVVIDSELSYKYDERTENLDDSFRRGLFPSFHNSLFSVLFSNVQFLYEYTLNGYFQTLRCFKNVERKLRKEHFQFKDHITAKVDSFFKEQVSKANTESGKEPIYVGIHIRRGDMANTTLLVDYGYTVATPSYIFNAINFFTNKFPSNKIIFIVCTDTKEWYIEHIEGRQKNVTMILSNNEDQAIDMAVLARCNHTIITVGSYGWWAAWMTGGTTVYYANWPRSGSKLDELFHRDDYFPKDWIPMV